MQRVHHVLNECLVDRGASPAMVCLECYIDGHHITTVQARLMADYRKDWSGRRSHSWLHG